MPTNPDHIGYGPSQLRDPRLLHDQIIDHGLVNIGDSMILKLLLIEMRRIRSDMAQMRISRNDPEDGPQHDHS